MHQDIKPSFLYPWNNHVTPTSVLLGSHAGCLFVKAQHKTEKCWLKEISQMWTIKPQGECVTGHAYTWTFYQHGSCINMALGLLLQAVIILVLHCVSVKHVLPKLSITSWLAKRTWFVNIFYIHNKGISLDIWRSVDMRRNSGGTTNVQQSKEGIQNILDTGLGVCVCVCGGCTQTVDIVIGGGGRSIKYVLCIKHYSSHTPMYLLNAA